MSLVEIHGRLANTVLIYTILMGVWGVWRFIRRQGVNGSYLGAVVIAEIVFIIQSALGVILWLSGPGRPAQGGVHVLYGVIAILVIPGVFLYTKGDQERRAMLVYGVSFLFLIGIALRAITTAG